MKAIGFVEFEQTNYFLFSLELFHRGPFYILVLTFRLLNFLLTVLSLSSFFITLEVSIGLEFSIFTSIVFSTRTSTGMPLQFF